MNQPPATKDLYSKEFLEEALKHKEAIDSEYQKIHKSFEKIAFNIYWIDENCAYTTFGYNNISDYAKAEHGIASSTCYNYINVVERFAKRDKDGNITAKISDDYKDYGSSKLALICGLTDEEIRELDITPETPARDIKKLLKSSPAREPEPEKFKKETGPEPWQLAESEQKQQPEDSFHIKTLNQYYTFGNDDLLTDPQKKRLIVNSLTEGLLVGSILKYISRGYDVEITAVRRERGKDTE